MIKLIKNLFNNYRVKRYRKICIRRVTRQAARVGNGLKINYKSYVTNNTYIGDNAGINGVIISGLGRVTIGDNFHCGSDCLIMTQNHNYDSGRTIPYDDTYIVKDVTIGDNVWFGSRVVILPGVEIGEGAIVQAGAVVSKSIPKFGISGGNPAKVFKYRDKEHYLSLKEKKMFY
jgi:acetyltransferase-like isoleucine patch superfamily enzyme